MRPDSALDHIRALATTAKEAWSLDTGEWELRSRERARTRGSAPVRKITIQVPQDWSAWLHKVPYVVGLAMIAVAIGLALRGDSPSVVGDASAAPAPAVAPVSRITATPIEEPAALALHSGITVTPIEEPIEEPIEPVVAPIEVPPEPTSSKVTKGKRRGKKARRAARRR